LNVSTSYLVPNPTSGAIAMTIDQGARQADAVVKIRTPRSDLIRPFVVAGLFIAIARSNGIGRDQLGFDPILLSAVSILIAQSLWALTWGVDLTPASAKLRGFRRRNIPWKDVQAVLRDDQVGSRTVRLILDEWEASNAASSDDCVWAGQGSVRAGLPQNRPVVASAPGRGLAPITS